MINKYGPETNYEDQTQRRLQVVYSRQTRERHIFMQDLKEFRKRKEKHMLKTVKKLIGPTWLQALSVPQRNALDTLKLSIYHDLHEGIPVRTAGIMRQLGLYPRPNIEDLMRCVYLGRNDPKEMLAQLFLMSYGHPIEAKRSSYCLNAKLMLSGILYLGLNNLLDLLKMKFRPDVVDKPQKPKPKQKPPPSLKSPYLQDMIAVMYLPPKRKPFTPAPLPNLDDLNKPFEEDLLVAKPPLAPPPPPAPPSNKRLPRAYCDKLAGFLSMEPETTVSAVAVKTITRRSRLHKTKASKMCVAVKETYGMSLSKRPRTRKLVNPRTGIFNAQYMINGVFKIHGETVFVLGTVSILPATGDLIIGGYRLMDGKYVNIHGGFRARSPSLKPDACDCVTKWQESAFKYAKETKCKCGHHYDYENEGTFPPEELPYFLKPTKFTPFQFNYETIYNIDQKQLFVEKEFKRIWETDSALRVGGDRDAFEKKNKKKKKTKKSSTTCLGNNPTPEHYLQCALRQMRRLNIAAKLPDIHLVPELKEWMRWRIYGPYSRSEKKEFLRRSNTFWQQFLTLAQKGYGRVSLQNDEKYSKHTNWIHKEYLNEKFRKFAQQYKLELYRSYADVTNMLWPTMYQAEFPDKKFREIYFSYLFGRIEEVQFLHPYSSRETIERKWIISKKRYCCFPGSWIPEGYI